MRRLPLSEPRLTARELTGSAGEVCCYPNTWLLRSADRLGPVCPARALTTAELRRRGVTTDVIGPITLVIDPHGPAGRARHAQSALTALAVRLAPPGMPFIQVLSLLHDQLNPPRGGPYVSGRRGHLPLVRPLIQTKLPSDLSRRFVGRVPADATPAVLGFTMAGHTLGRAVLIATAETPA